MTDSPPTAAPQPKEKTPSPDRIFWCLLVLALAGRVIVLSAFRENLTDDRDAYLAIAHQISEGNGFRSAADAPLTAYRPPLYPIVLALPLTFLPVATSVAAVNLALSLLTVGVVWSIARERGTTFAAAAATAVVSFDPLLLSNVALPMTETMFTALLAALVYFAIRVELSRRDRLAVGLLFGMAALCRPTVWAFGAIAGFTWLVIQIRQPSARCGAIIRKALPTVCAATVVLAPWVIRNAVEFREFIPMTTHGGYTLLLANNPAFYQEVVRRGWRTTWEGESLAKWQRSLEAEMAAETPPIVSETERDRWMSARARTTIRNHPGVFLQSCLTRLLRFWNPVPISTPARPVPTVLGCGIGIFSVGLFLGVLVACVRRQPGDTDRVDWLRVCAWCLIISLTLVHLIYWSNLRMRAPLEPFLALLTIGGFRRSRLNGVQEAAQRNP